MSNVNLAKDRVSVVCEAKYTTISVSKVEIQQKDSHYAAHGVKDHFKH